MIVEYERHGCAEGTQIHGCLRIGQDVRGDDGLHAAAFLSIFRLVIRMRFERRLTIYDSTHSRKTEYWHLHEIDNLRLCEHDHGNLSRCQTSSFFEPDHTSLASSHVSVSFCSVMGSLSRRIGLLLVHLIDTHLSHHRLLSPSHLSHCIYPLCSSHRMRRFPNWQQHLTGRRIC